MPENEAWFRRGGGFDSLTNLGQNANCEINTYLHQEVPEQDL